MNRKNIFFVAIAILFIIHAADSGFVTVIDNFTPDVVVPLVAVTYNTFTTNLTYQLSDGNETIGTERDSILFLDAGADDLLVVSSITNSSWGIGWQNTLGYAQLQYDGFDNSPNLTLTPGLGGFDVTQGFMADGLVLQISADHPSPYIVNFYGPTIDLLTSYEFEAPATANSVEFNTYYIPFSLFTGNADLTNIFGIELTLNISLASESAAIDTTVLTFATFGYVISGHVFVDCNSNGVQDAGEDDLVNATVSLYTASTGQLFEFQLTDDSGDFYFFGLSDGDTFSVCVTATGYTSTIPKSGCYTAVLSNLNDVTGLTYGEVSPTSLIIPANQNVQACGCTTPNCTGFATGTSCGGGNITYTDSVSGNSCLQTISRTWRINGTNSAGTQTITVKDTLAPVISPGALDETVSCDDQFPSLTDWLNADGYAQATDCNGFSWSNSWDHTPTGNCANKDIVFTVTDICNNAASTSANYTTFDHVSPFFAIPSSSSVAQCDQSGSDFVAFNAWLASAGDATITDNCEPSNLITVVNNYVANSLQRGCDNSQLVVFTANDNCGNIATSGASFTIQDTLPPSFVVFPTNSSAQCTGDGAANNSYTAWLNNHASAVATDECTPTASIAWSNNAGSLQLGCNTANTVTFTASDLCGHSVSASAIFLIIDTTPPAITVQPEGETVSCTSNITAAYNDWINDNAGAVAVDACTQGVVWSDSSNFTTLPECGSVPVTFFVSDLCANPNTYFFTAYFTITDTTPPTVLTAPENLQVQCNSNITQQFDDWLFSAGYSQFSDVCTSVTVTNNFPNNGVIPSTCHQQAVVQFTARDSCGNPTFTTATFSVTDTSPPVISPPASNLTVQCNATSNQQSYNQWLQSFAGAGSNDACGSAIFTYSAPASISIGSSCSVQQTVTFTATDSCGLSSPTTATFIITDTQNPILQTPASDRTEPCDGTGNAVDFGNWRSTHGGAVVSDACTSVSWSDNYVGFTPSVNCSQYATLTFVASDACGLSVSTTATYTITDNQGPKITSPAQSTAAQCNGQGDTSAISIWLNEHANATAFDLCDGTNLIWKNNFGNTSITTCRSVQVTFTVYDSCGYYAQTTGTFSVIDKIPPTFAPPPSNEQVQCDGQGNIDDYNQWVSSHGGGNATDVCSPVINWSTTAPAFGPVGCGSVTAAFIATDICNLTSVATATFQVLDDVPPVVNPVPSDYTVECDGTGNVLQLGDWLFNHGFGSATDSCYPNVTWTNNFKTVTVISACLSSATVTFTTKDACGNLAVNTATFNIVDTTPPVISPGASSITIPCDATLNPAQVTAYLTNHGGASATDLCSSAVTWTYDYVPGNNPCGSGVEVIFTASDACGNSDSTNATVSLIDTAPPEFVSFPPDVIVNCSGCTTVNCTGVPVITDACSPASTLTLNHVDYATTLLTIGNCPGNQVISRSWTAIDACGNFITRNQTIVIDIAAPVGPCTPAICPSCNNTGPICCANNSAPLPCNAVACKAVTCLQVSCTPVECIPVVCGSISTPTVSPTPIPAPPPDYEEYYYLCEPVYIYVYNDDGINDENDINAPVIKYIYEYISNGAPSQSVFSVLTLVIMFISLFF